MGVDRLDYGRTHGTEPAISAVLLLLCMVAVTAAAELHFTLVYTQFLLSNTPSKLGIRGRSGRKMSGFGSGRVGSNFFGSSRVKVFRVNKSSGRVEPGRVKPGRVTYQ